MLLKSSGSIPEHSDALMMSVIGLINTSRHDFRSVVGSGLGSHNLLGHGMIIFLTLVIVAGLNYAS